MFHCVLAMWHHKAKLKVKALKQTVTEVMPLDHAELTHWFLTNGKLHTEQSTNTQPAHIRLITSLLYTGNNHTYSIIRADPGNAN